VTSNYTEIHYWVARDCDANTRGLKFVCIAEYVSYIDDSCIVATMINLKDYFRWITESI